MVILAGLFCSFIGSFSQQESGSFIYPDSSWEKISKVSDYGWDSAKLNEVKKFILDSTHATGFLVIQSGKVLFEHGDLSELSTIASGRKSVLAILYGPYVESGKIHLAKTLFDLNVDDKYTLTTQEKQATIEHLLTAQSGVFHPYTGMTESSPKFERGSVKAGEVFYYNNWQFDAAGFIFEKLSGLNIYDAVDSMIAKPLMMQDWKRSEQNKTVDTFNSYHPAYPMRFSTRDMARIGYLMLRNGQWHHRQITPKNWVRKITSVVTPFAPTKYRPANAAPQLGYGYLWWVWNAPYNKGAFEGAYTAWGILGQFITVLPKLDAVITMKTKQIYQRETSMKTYLRLLDLLVEAKR